LHYGLIVTTHESQLADDWKAWVAENLLEGVPEKALMEALVSAGTSLDFAKDAIGKLTSCSMFSIALKKAAIWRKRDSLLQLYQDLFRQSGAHTGIERRQFLSPEAFYRDYYYANRPVVVQGWMQKWAAMRMWSPQYLKEKFGSAEIQITTNRSADPDYEFNVHKHKTRTTVGRFVDLVVSGGRTNDYYLVAQNFAIEDTGLSKLVDDLGTIPGVTDPNDTHRSIVSIWFGPAGTITPLHHDGTNILFGQIYGRKKFRLAPAFELPYMYNNRWVFSKVDLSAPDYEKYPLLRKADFFELVLEPGEMLFIPVGWWHWVEALDISISLNLQNFLVPDGNTPWHNEDWYLEPLY
jgi:hypothetical protein